MTRFRLDLAYDGTNFHGWAAQPGQRTVEGALQEAVAAALVIWRRPPEQLLVVAGRTDAGVHARHQVAHLDVDLPPDDAPALTGQLRRLLPSDVAMHSVSPAPAGFDARFAATGRTYCYRLWDATSLPDPTLRHVVTALTVRLDTNAMAVASANLLGLRDFTAFCRPKAGGTAIRNLRRFDVTRLDDAPGTIECWLEADAFCHSMVRSLVGAITEVGAGHRDLAWLAATAARPQRANDVPVLPPGGLTLEAVTYPPDDQLAARVALARSVRQPASKVT